MKSVCIIQARMGSSRLPGKILMDISGKPMLQHIVERVKRCGNVDEVIVATSKNNEDKKVMELCRRFNYKCFAGSEDDVLDRYYQAALKFGAGIIVSITGDCPLVDPIQIDKIIDIQKKTKADYVNNLELGLPLGIGAEAFTFAALKKSWEKGKLPHHREHVDDYILENPQEFKTERFYPEEWMKKPYRLTVDTNEDLTLIRTIYGKLYRNGSIVELEEVYSLLEKEPELIRINKNIIQRKAK